MSEPVVFGFPISLLFLYFIIYSFLGWILETVYCSVRERRFVARGFLYGPICPIYGVGVLMMLCWFAPFTGQPLLFYVVATVCMSAWEYLVGWLLETTTHIKYWDYSTRKFNLLVLLAADAAATIRELALLTAMLRKLTQMGEELQVQLALSRAELSDRLDEARDVLSDKLDGAKESISDKLDEAKESISDKLDEAKESISGRIGSALDGREADLAALRRRYSVLLRKAERQTRHLRYVYRSMSSSTLSTALSQLSEAGRRAMSERARKRAARRQQKKGNG